MLYRHFVWDFDGTLFDTYPRMTKSFQHALAARARTIFCAGFPRPTAPTSVPCPRKR